MAKDRQDNSADPIEDQATIYDIEPEQDGAGEDWKKKCEEAEKNLLYSRAEFDNYKKNAIKERSDLLKFGAERLARDLIGVLDVFDQALQTEINEKTIESFKKGVELTAHQLRTTLEKHGIHEIDSHGKAFDPQHHEALSAESTSDFPDGHISKVFKKAYKYHDRVLRHGQVIVAQNPGKARE